MQKIFFISDTHFNHEKVIEYCNRPFKDVVEMNQTLINNWNSVVSNEDIVWFLGDWGMGSREVIRKLISKLNGRKRMIYGNHDHFSIDFYKSCGIEFASKYPVIIANKYILSHAPINSNTGDLINIYGHIHNKILADTYPGICVCVEQINYTPKIIDL